MLLRRRENMEELMDRPETTASELEDALSDLEWTNRWLGGRSALIPYVIPALKPGAKVLDAACGSGDMLRVLADWCRKRGWDAQFYGLDINRKVLEIARRRCCSYDNISFVEADATYLPFPDCGFDVVCSSTFIHHLASADVESFLKESARTAGARVVVSDLVRSDLAFMGISVIGLGFGRISRRDGMLSFRRAYTPSELARLAESAGLTGARIFRYPFYRMTLVYDRPVLCSSDTG